MTRHLLLSAGLAGMLCVDVKIDQVAYLDCLIEMFRAAFQPGQIALVPNPAATQAPAAGTYNRAATQEMLGQSFGHSVTPARPVPPAALRFPR
jgi:hypothetical protein